MYCAADTKVGLRWKGVLLTVYCIVSRGYQGWSEGEGVIVKGILYRVADTKGGLRGRGTFKGILYRVADTKRGVRGRGINKGILYRIADTKGGLRGRGIVKGLLYRVAGSKGSLREEWVLLRIYCIVSRIPRVF